MTRAGRHWAELRLALSLLTRMPVGAIDPCPAPAAAVWAYPLAGLVPGLACGLALWAGQAAGLAPLAAALVALAASAWATGGLHEDGLADMTDGLSGGRTPARRLEIMRDSRVGSHGALALILATGLRAAALAELAGPAALAVPLTASMLSRGGLPMLMAALPPARPGGLGAGAAEGLRGRTVAAAAVVAMALAAVLVGLPAALGAAGVGVACMAAVGILARRRLGGQTGDVLGAALIVAETSMLLVLAGP